MSRFEEIWKEEVEKINDALDEFISMKRERASHMGAIHDEYYDNIKEYIMRGGKRLRPLALIVAHKAVKREIEVDHLYRAACSLEILHNGSLLHDDLIDHDETRRGGPTFHARYREWFKNQFGGPSERATDFGMTLAILGGDSLINLGGEAINASELSPEVGMKLLNYYQQGFSDLVEGVLLEMTMIKDPTVEEATYMEMVYRKTATLFQKALQMGATVAGASDSQLEAFSEFGSKVGQAFQMQDDILGSFGDEEVTGKSTEGDIREAKKTMLLIKALELSKPDQKKILSGLLGKVGMTGEDVEKVRLIFRESGAQKATEEIRDRLLNEAQSALKNASPPLDPEYLEFLIKLSVFLTTREF
ncbi:MAG: polyprenyl synthetase family protein [Candidatus Thorarchaeota archaeon]|jgi:geranylgeranyl diphosphate synthase type I